MISYRRRSSKPIAFRRAFILLTSLISSRRKLVPGDQGGCAAHLSEFHKPNGIEVQRRFSCGERERRSLQVSNQKQAGQFGGDRGRQK